MPDELVLQWVEKAEEDWIGIQRLIVDDTTEVADLVCFLSQQCAEKYLKALIQAGDDEPSRLHHLPVLLDNLLIVYPDLQHLRNACEQLTPYAVAFRYPGEKASADEAGEAIEWAKEIRRDIKNKLNIAKDIREEEGKENDE